MKRAVVVVDFQKALEELEGAKRVEMLISTKWSEDAMIEV